MTIEEFEDESVALKNRERTRSRAFQVVIGQVKAGLSDASAAVSVLPDGEEKTKAVSLLRSLEAKTVSLLASDYEGAMNAVQLPEEGPETAPTVQTAPIVTKPGEHVINLIPDEHTAPISGHNAPENTSP